MKGGEALLEYGAASVSACATHAILSGPAGSTRNRQLWRVVTNSIPLTKRARQCSKINALSVAPLLARAVQSIHEETSVSILFV